jgi:L-amino acid N-acyltransferase YncA
MKVEVKKAPLITFQQESWDSYFEDIGSLWEEHKSEVGSADQMKINIPLYRGLEARGELFILTARRAGHIVGYVVAKICPHPHYDFLAAFEDGYFLHKSVRGEGLGKKIFEETFRLLAKRGVKKGYFHSKTLKTHRELFLTLGCFHSDEIWTKVL